MKLKYIIPSILAVITMFMGCSEEFKASYLGNIRVSSSYLAIPGGGGSAEMTVSANGDWTLSDVPEWLTVAPMSGSAGETTVTVSAPATKGALNATIKITCGTSVQEINVTQGKVVVEPATCKQIIDGEDGKTYRVTGKVTSIGNTTYGNWYLQDETGEVYIYGTLDKNGATKNFSSLGIEIGDQVTVEGPKKTYNGTVELVDVTVLNIEKSLLKVVAPEEIPEISKTGGELELKVAFKGKGVMPEVNPEYSWIHYRSMKVEAGTVSAVNPNPADTAYVKFTFDANEGKSRKGEIVLSSTNGTENSSITIAITQEADVLPHGENPEDPFTVAEAVAKCLAIGNTSDGVIYYAKGIISSISSIDTGSYGNATFNISDDGTETNAITCFRSFFLENAKFTSADQIAVGDEVIITGKLVNYKDKNGNETPEFSGNVYIYKHTKASNDPGSKAKPFTPAEANAFCQTLTPGNPAEDAPDYYVKGKIVKYANNGEFGTQYGNATFYISVDGQESSEQFYVFRTLYLGNVKYTDDTWTKPAVGDEVVICGKLMLYKKSETELVPETAANKSYIYTLNGKTN